MHASTAKKFVLVLLGLVFMVSPFTFQDRLRELFMAGLGFEAICAILGAFLVGLVFFAWSEEARS